MFKKTHLVIGLMLLNIAFITAQSKMGIRDMPIIRPAIQKHFVAEGLVSPNWKMGEKYIYDVLNEGRIILIDLSKFKAIQQGKGANLDRLPETLPSKTLLLSDDVPKRDMKRLGFDPVMSKTVDSLFSGNYTKQFVAIFPNKQVKYMTASELEQIETIGKDKMQVSIRYETYIKHIKCTNVNDASIVLRAFEGAAPYSFKWSNGQTTDKIDNLGTGEYTCTITDALGNQKITKPIQIDIAPKLTVNLSQKMLAQTNAVDINTTYTGGVSPFEFRWLRDSTAISSEKNIANLSTGFYKLRVRDGLGCKYDYPIVVGEPINLKDKGLTYSANIYPNPSSGKMTLNLNDPLYNSDIEVIDAIGRIVHQLKVNNSETVFDLTFLSEGIYNVKISNPLGSIYKKLIIKK